MMGKYFAANNSSYVVYGGLAAETFSSLIEDVQFGEKGIAFILDRDGTVVGTSTSGVPQLAHLTGEEPLESSMVKAIDAILRTGTGTTELEHDGQKYIAGYTGLDTPEEWSIVVATPKAPLIRSVWTAALLVVFIALALTAAAVIISINRAGKIAEPIAVTSRRILDMAEGDLHREATVFRTNDEIETMSESMSHMVTSDGADHHLHQRSGQGRPARALHGGFHESCQGYLPAHGGRHRGDCLRQRGAVDGDPSDHGERGADFPGHPDQLRHGAGDRGLLQHALRQVRASAGAGRAL